MSQQHPSSKPSSFNTIAEARKEYPDGWDIGVFRGPDATPRLAPRTRDDAFVRYLWSEDGVNVRESFGPRAEAQITAFGVERDGARTNAEILRRFGPLGRNCLELSFVNALRCGIPGWVVSPFPKHNLGRVFSEAASVRANLEVLSHLLVGQTDKVKGGWSDQRRYQIIRAQVDGRSRVIAIVFGSFNPVFTRSDFDRLVHFPKEDQPKLFDPRNDRVIAVVPQKLDDGKMLYPDELINNAFFRRVMRSEGEGKPLVEVEGSSWIEQKSADYRIRSPRYAALVAARTVSDTTREEIADLLILPSVMSVTELTPVEEKPAEPAPLKESPKKAVVDGEPVTLYGVQLPSNTRLRWCTTAGCSGYKRLRLIDGIQNVKCGGTRSDKAVCDTELKVPGKRDEDKAKPQIQALIEARKVLAAAKAEEKPAEPTPAKAAKKSPAKAKSEGKKPASKKASGRKKR